MRCSIVLLALATSLSLGSAATCNADNCARAVTGYTLGPAVQSSRRDDCSSFFRTTVTPRASTSTVTATITASTSTNVATTDTVTSTTVVSTETDITVTVTTATSPLAQKRQVTVIPSGVPSYASACSGTARYSSACSCFGVAKSTITAPTPVVTVTVTTTTTPVTTITSSTTLVIPVTSTTLVTSVSTSVACGGVTPGGGSCGCSYLEQCNTQFVDNGDGSVAASASSLSDCVARCDNNLKCAAFSYQSSTGNCVQLKGGYAAVPNSDYTSGPISTCQGDCTQAYRRDLEALEMLKEVETKGRREAQPVGGKKYSGDNDN